MQKHAIHTDFPNAFKVICDYALEMEKDMIEHAFLCGLNEGLKIRQNIKKLQNIIMKNIKNKQ